MGSNIAFGVVLVGFPCNEEGSEDRMGDRHCKECPIRRYRGPQKDLRGPRDPE